MIRIIIADDHRLFRETMGALLGSRDDMNVIALCKDSDEALEAIRNEQPDVVLLDIKMTPLSGIAATQQIRRFSDVKVIGLSMFTLPSYATNIFRAGGNGYITKNSALGEIFTGIDTVMKGKRYVCKEVMEIMVAAEIEPDQRPPDTNLLTSREIETAQLISQGLSSREIALALNCTSKTIEVLRHNMLKKLKLKNTVELINFLSFQIPDAF